MSFRFAELMGRIGERFLIKVEEEAELAERAEETEEMRANRKFAPGFDGESVLLLPASLLAVERLPGTKTAFIE